MYCFCDCFVNIRNKNRHTLKYAEKTKKWKNQRKTIDFQRSRAQFLHQNSSFGAKLSQDAAKMAPRWSKIAQRWPKILPRCPILTQKMRFFLLPTWGSLGRFGKISWAKRATKKKCKLFLGAQMAQTNDANFFGGPKWGQKKKKSEF